MSKYRFASFAVAMVVSGLACAQPAPPAFQLDELAIRQSPPHLRFVLHQTGPDSESGVLRLIGEKQSLGLDGLADGSIVGRVRAGVRGYPKADFTIRLGERTSPREWRIEVYPDAIGYASTAVGTGVIRNSKTGFELELQVADWLLWMNRDGSLRSLLSERQRTSAGHARWTVEFSFGVPIAVPSQGDLAFQVSGAVPASAFNAIVRSSNRLLIHREEQ